MTAATVSAQIDELQQRCNALKRQIGHGVSLDADSSKQQLSRMKPEALLTPRDQKAADDQCGENASCKSVQMGIGLCTYDD